ncbi:MAG: M20/M25/M40 family metallo-hydrolase [Acidobacteriota bacterium]
MSPAGGTAGAGAQSPLSPTEREIIRYADGHDDEAIVLLERVVNINSGTMNLVGVREVGRVFQAEFDALGFASHWVDGTSFQRAGHLLAERHGQGPNILLIGHLDTVFEADSPFQRFERLNETTARGPGIIDMKGGDVILIQALKALASAGVLEGMSLTVILTGDEEKSGRPLEAARRALLAAAEWADIAIGFEDGDGDPRTAVVARRGSAAWRLNVTATPAHSSQIFRKGVGFGAILETARILNGFRERMAEEPYLTFNPGLVLGGTTVDLDSLQARGSAFGKENVIAQQSVVTGDLRCISPQQLEQARRTMRAVVADHLPQALSQITFLGDGYPPMAPTEGNNQLLRLYDQTSRDLGLGGVTATSPTAAGAADISFAAALVKMALDGVGLMGHDDHTVGETADLSTIGSQTKRAALLLYRLARREEN